MSVRRARPILLVGTGALEPFLPRNPHRVGILLSPPASSSYVLAIGQGTGQSFQMTTGSSPFFLSKEMIGESITDEIQVATSGAGVIVPAMEVTEA